MKPVQPRLEQFRLPPGARVVQVAEHQNQFETLPSIVMNGKLVSQWEPTAEELVQLNNGAPITLVLYCGFPQPPVCLAVGGLDLTSEES